MTTEPEGTTGEKLDSQQTLITNVLRIALVVFVLGIGVAGAVIALSFSDVGSRFPLFVSIGVIVSSIVVLVREVWVMRKGGVFSAAAFDYQLADVAPATVLRKGLAWLGLIVGYILTMALVGYMFATIVWLFLTLVFGAKVRWYWAIVATAVGFGLLELLVNLLSLPMPEGIVYLGL